MIGKRRLYRYGVLALIGQFGGELAFLNQIAETQKRGEISRKQAHDLRETVRWARAGVRGHDRQERCD